MKKILLSLILPLLIFSTGQAATLLEADWATGSTCSGTNLNDGVWTTGDNSDCTYNFNIGTGGPGGRNYLIMNIPNTDSTSVLGNNPSLGNPSTMYIRFWFRKLFNGGAGAHFVWVNDEVGNYGACLMRSWDASTFSILPDYSYNEAFYYTGDFSFNTWYLMEYKIVNAGSGSANASMFVKMDGVDVTSSFAGENGGTLTTHNGSLQISALNQFYMSSYQQGTTGHYLDLAGLKITDDNWIGGDTDTTAPVVTADDTTKSISSDSYSAEGDASDAVGVTGCTWKIGAGSPSACTGTTSWTCSTSGYSSGSNTLTIACVDAASNEGTDTVTVTYTPPASSSFIVGGTLVGGKLY